MQDDPMITINFRLPASMLREVDSLSGRERRSRNSQLLRLIEGALERSKPKPAQAA